MSSYQSLRREFRDPAAAYRPMMHWIWNGLITSELIERDLADFKEHGIGGVVLLAAAADGFLNRGPEGLRPVSRLQPDYLSDAFFEMVRHACRTARDLGLHIWLYDDGDFPSGSAVGRVMQGHPEFYAAGLVSRTVPAGEAGAVPENCSCAVAVMPGGGLHLLEIGTGEPLSVPAGAAQVCFFIVERLPIHNGTHLADTLNPACTRRFIELTHQRYYDFCGEFFGNVIPGIFTDEVYHPGMTDYLFSSYALAWTPGIWEKFQQRRGYDIRPFLLLLYPREALGLDLVRYREEQEVASLRCEFYDFVIDLFQEAYWKQITDWCRERGIMHTGHVGGEDTLKDHRGRFGDVFRTAGALAAPGVDTIGRQIFPGQEHFPFPLFISSAARLKPGHEGFEDTPWNRLVITESYAAYGIGLDYARMRWIADYQFLLGVNCLMPIGVNTDREFHPVCGDHIGRGNPLWGDYAGFADYIGRLSRVLRQDFAVAEVAVYYPIEPLWADPVRFMSPDHVDSQAVVKAAASLEEICRVLLQKQTGFDFIDAGTITASAARGGVLSGRGYAYTTVIVPETSLLSPETAARLLELQEGGGRVVFCGRPPFMSSRRGGQETFDRIMAELLRGAEVTDRLDVCRLSGPGPSFRELRLAGPVPELMLSRRRAGDLVFHFLLNTADRPLSLSLALSGGEALLVEEWDASDGEVNCLGVHPAAGPETSFNLDLPSFGSSLLLVRPRPAEMAEPEIMLRSDGRLLSAWEAAERAEVVEVCDIQGGGLTDQSGLYRVLEGPVPLLPWEELGLAGLSGSVEYLFRPFLNAEDAGGCLRLVLPEVRYAAAVRVNGRPAGDSLLWPPYEADVSGLLRAGENEIVVRISNTPANQVLEDEFQRAALRQGWTTNYFKREWVAQSLRSGLIGRVLLYQDERK